MILADKIINLRKKNGWTQEELAEKVNVSRQSVSKWEGAQSIPDLNKILLLSQIFEVSTDYLLRDELEEITNEETTSYNKEYLYLEVHKVSMKESLEFLKIREKYSRLIAIGVAMLILAPAIFLLMESFGNNKFLGEGLATGLLLIIVALSVGIFIYSGSELGKFEYMEKENIETEYGVYGLVKEKLDNYKKIHTIKITLGVVAMILSLIPLIIVDSLNSDEFTENKMLAIILLVVAIAVYNFVESSMKVSSLEMLIQKGDYTLEKKKFNNKSSISFDIYWLLIVAIYLGYSLFTNDWGRSWILWPIAGIFYLVFVKVFEIYNRINEKM